MRTGRLETASVFGTVFLDEIGEISQEIQVKLLRLLQDRRFQRLGENDSAPLSKEDLDWIGKNFPSNYEWSGNVRELEQWVFNILVRGTYNPPEIRKTGTALFESFSSENLSADDVLSRFCQILYRRTKNYSETARILHVDRRTVKSWIEK